MTKIVALYNNKGGVSKTTTLFRARVGPQKLNLLEPGRLHGKSSIPLDRRTARLQRHRRCCSPPSHGVTV
jgi:hypothetical protein